MVCNMKTTVDIADALLQSAKEVSAREGTTVRALIEEGLRQALAKRQKSGSFRLRKASFSGKGILPEIEEGSWDTIRGLIYRGRGE